MSKLNVQNTLKAKYANDKTPKPKALIHMTLLMLTFLNMKNYVSFSIISIIYMQIKTEQNGWSKLLNLCSCV